MSPSASFAGAPRAPIPVRTLAALLVLALAACARAPAPAAPTPVTEVAGVGPGFASRGVIEGFYGPPWSHQDRLDMLRFMGRVGLNTYIYAPKDDPYHRERWREPYPSDQLARIAELVRVGRDAGVNVWFAISPGLSMRYSDDADYQALLAKLEAVRAIGLRHVGLFLDDVPETLTHPEDRARFASLAAAHAYVIQRLKSDLDSRGVALAVVPTTYTNAFGSRDYARELGAALPPGIPLGWTGVDVLPPEITVPQAREWGALIRREPLIWDNYPVNDYARWRPFLGPLRGRAPDLAAAVNGFVSNPMNEAHASMLPLWTVADYLRDPMHYDPARSLDSAVVALYGRAGADVVRPFVAAYGNWLGEPGPIDPLYIPSRAFNAAAASRAVAAMQAALQAMRGLAARDSATWSPLLRELSPFADTAAARLALLRADTLYVARGDSLVFRSELDRIDVERASRPPTVDGDLRDWSDAAWRPMFTRAGARGLSARIALRADAGSLYVALQVPDTAVSPAAGDTVANGDHVAVVVSGNPAGAPTRMSDQDLLLLATPGTGARPAAIDGRSLRMTWFFRNAIAEHRDFTFSDFFLSNLSIPPAPRVAPAAAGARVASARAAGGWRMEISIPRAGLPVASGPSGNVARVSVVVADMRPGPPRLASLGPRNYPGNPAAYTVLVLPR